MPIVIACVFAGGAFFAAMIGFASIIMLYEWSRMVERRSLTKSFYVLAIGACLAMYFAARGEYVFAILGAAFTAGFSVFTAKRDGGIGVWVAFGCFYIIVPCIALLWLRLDAPDGFAMTVILFSVVWAADTGAFFFGKFIGGPKISYALSPHKTWAGIGGGVLGGSIAGACAAMMFFGPQGAKIYFFVGSVLGAASVLGDLLESGFKRNFGLKDISGLIPGHGGALDRLDGMILATLTMTAGLLVYMLAENIQG